MFEELNNYSTITPKKTYIEWLRVISMIAVVFTHIGATAHTDFSDTYYNHFGGFFFQSIVYISHFAVPVFFMISGALLLNPDKEITINKLFSKYIFRYGMVLLIFGWGFAYIECVFTSKKIVLTDIYKSMVNMLEGKSWAHMWYLYSLFGLMLILPLIKSFVKHASTSSIIYIILIVIIFTSFFPTICSLTGFSIGINFPINNLYIGYMLMGYVLDHKNIKITIWLGMLEIICVTVLISTAYFNIMHNQLLPFGSYDSPIIILHSTFIFCVAKQTLKKISHIINFLSEASFGVYLTHMLWINLTFKFLKINPVLPTPLTGIVIALITLFFSVILTYIMKKLPIFKKLL